MTDEDRLESLRVKVAHLTDELAAPVERRFVEEILAASWGRRVEMIGYLKDHICMYCGGEGGCQCWNDE